MNITPPLKLKEEEFYRERKRESELCDGEENASLNKLITDTLFIYQNRKREIRKELSDFYKTNFQLTRH